MRFVVDRHLGHLARWLRTIGYDAFFEVDASNERLREQSARSDTVFITTVKELAERIGAVTPWIVPKEDLGRQLQTIRDAIGEPLTARIFTRCVICNVPVKPISKDLVKDKVPEAVRERVDSYTVCPSCGRVYWEGTHTTRLRKRLASLVGGEHKE